MTGEELKKLFVKEPEIIEKWQRFMRKKLDESNPLMRWCTKPGCSGTMMGENMDATKLDCPECKTSICFRCREEWHGTETTCEVAMEKKFEGFCGGIRNIGFCPMCRTKIEKTEGCNMMTCGFCEFRFCWLCKKEATYNHFANPSSPCYEALYAEEPLMQGWCCKILKFLGRFLLYLLFGPLFLVFATPVYLVKVSYDIFKKCCGWKCGLLWCILLLPVTIVIGLALDLFTIPVLLIAGIVYLLGEAKLACCFCCYEGDGDGDQIEENR